MSKVVTYHLQYERRGGPIHDPTNYWVDYAIDSTPEGAADGNIEAVQQKIKADSFATGQIRLIEKTVETAVTVLPLK